MNNLIDNLSFILERLDWLSIIDILLVTIIFFGLLLLLRDTQAVTLLRGVILIVTLLALVTSFQVLPAFSWMVRATLPTLLVAIPVIFAPEIRRALERLGRAGGLFSASTASQGLQDTITIVIQACMQLSSRRHGALVVMQRFDGLQEFTQTGVVLNAVLTQKLLQQLFYPNTPLHDGAVIIANNMILAAACVMPLAAGDIQTLSPERQMGLRHRAAIGISEVSDAVVIVVSEETGAISVAYGGRIIRRLDSTRLENILNAFFRPLQPRRGLGSWIGKLFQSKGGSK